MENQNILAHFEHDPSVNMGMLIFAEAEGRATKAFPVADGEGNVLTIVTFAEDGQLLNLELFDVKKQFAAPPEANS